MIFKPPDYSDFYVPERNILDEFKHQFEAAYKEAYEEGLQLGIRIGKIQMCQELLGEEITSCDDLMKLGRDGMTAMLAELKPRVFARYS